MVNFRLVNFEASIGKIILEILPLINPFLIVITGQGVLVTTLKALLPIQDDSPPEVP